MSSSVHFPSNASRVIQLALCNSMSDDLGYQVSIDRECRWKKFSRPLSDLQRLIHMVGTAKMALFRSDFYAMNVCCKKLCFLVEKTCLASLTKRVFALSERVPRPDESRGLWNKLIHRTIGQMQEEIHFFFNEASCKSQDRLQKLYDILNDLHKAYRPSQPSSTQPLPIFSVFLYSETARSLLSSDPVFNLLQPQYESISSALVRITEDLMNVRHVAEKRNLASSLKALESFQSVVYFAISGKEMTICERIFFSFR